MAEAKGMEATLWTDPQHAETVMAILSRMGVAIRPIAVGGPRAAGVSDLAESVNLKAQDDPRQMLNDHPAAFLLLAAAGVGPDILQHALTQGTIILTIEPAWESLDPLGINGKKPTSSSGRCMTVPSFQRSPGWANAADPTEILGKTRSISFTSFGHTGECSLFARLYDAWETLLAFIPIPQSIDASITGPLDQPPDDLRAVTGHLTAHIRVTAGSSATLQVSDNAGSHFRALRLLGDHANLAADDLNYHLADSKGKPLDHKEMPSAGPGSLFPDLVARQWKQIVERPQAIPPTPPAQSAQRVLACCLATLLSARTGQPESPATLLSLHGLE